MLYKSLHFKLVLILVLFIICIISIIAAVMLNGVFDFYIQNFNEMIDRTLGEQTLKELCGLMNSEGYYIYQKDMLKSEFGNLGATRNLYILDMDGRYLTGTDENLGLVLEKTPNMVAAMAKKAGDSQSFDSNYMDYAVYLSNDMYGLDAKGEIRECIIYIKDTQEEMRKFSWKMFAIIIQVLLIGLAVAVLLSFFLAKAITAPIQNITRGALKLSEGDFKKKIEVSSNDEIGTLTLTFNDMAEKLQTIEQSRREFIANVSHELRTPLSAILGAAESIADPRMSEENKIRFLSMIQSEAERMTKIVQDLLVIVRLDNKKMFWEYIPCEFKAIVKNIYETMRGEAEKNEQSFTWKTEKNIPIIYADKERIEQVLLNIVSNAIKYTPKGGKIEVFLAMHRSKAKNAEEGPGIKITVTDNGIGIPKEDLPHIFERFYRVEKARSSESGGTGLGLAIAYEIVCAHKGNITIENVESGGTLVSVTLPQNSKANSNETNESNETEELDETKNK